MAALVDAVASSRSIASPVQCVYVANYGGTVSAIDTRTNTLAANVPVGCCLNSVAVSPDGTFAYVAQYGGVAVVDTSTNRVTATIPLGAVSIVERIAFRPDGAFAYATARAQLGIPLNAVSIAVIDTSARTVVAHIPQASGITVSPDGALAYAIKESPDFMTDPSLLGLLVFDTKTNAVVATIPDVTGRDVVVTPDGRFIYVSGPGAPNTMISVVDTATRRVSNTLQVEGGIEGIAISADSRFAYLANYSAAAVSVIGVPNGDPVASIPIEGLPFRIAVTPDGMFAYVTTLSDFKKVQSPGVVVIDLATNAVTATVPFWGGGYGIAIASVPGGCAAPTCEGDCNGDGEITIDELLTAVNINLRNWPLSACPAYEAGENGHVPIDALIRAVNSAVNGCPMTASPTAQSLTTAASNSATRGLRP